MPLVKVKPTSPGRRALVKVVNPELHKGDPYWPLTQPQKRGSGRNNYGRITARFSDIPPASPKPCFPKTRRFDQKCPPSPFRTP